MLTMFSRIPGSWQGVQIGVPLTDQVSEVLAGKEKHLETLEEQ
jgi:hypothetical protein